MGRYQLKLERTFQTKEICEQRQKERGSLMSMRKLQKNNNNVLQLESG